MSHEFQIRNLSLSTETKKITVKSASGNTEYQSDSEISQKTFLQIEFQTRPTPQPLLNSPSISDLALTSVNVLGNILDLTETPSNINMVIDKTNDILFSIRTTPSKGLTIAPEVTISSPIRIQLALIATPTVPEDEKP